MDIMCAFSPMDKREVERYVEIPDLVIQRSHIFQSFTMEGGPVSLHVALGLFRY